MAQVHTLKSDYGLGGVLYLSGSVSASCFPSFKYYPITNTTVTSMKLTGSIGGNYNAVNGISASFGAGQPFYGFITEITQSSGLAMVYRAVTDRDDF